MFSQISISIFHFKVKKKVKKEQVQKEPVHESERMKLTENMCVKNAMR